MTHRVCITIIWICFILLLTLGIIMVGSTSTVDILHDGGDGHEFLLKQVGFALTGLVLALGVSCVDYRLARYCVPYIWIGCTILLILCFVPGVGLTLNGESRWINLGVQFQPSELAKICLMLCLAHWYTLHRERVKSLTYGFLIPGLIFGIPLFLILIEKDMGTAAALGLSGFCLMLAAGTRWWVLALAVLCGALVLFQFTTDSPNRMGRIEALQDLEAYRRDQGLQQWVAQQGFERGGTTGVGLGDGAEKYGELPYAHTDFIYAIIGSELGLVGTAGVLFLFTLMMICAILLALHTTDLFGRYLCVGLAFTLFWPAMVNMMVVSGMLPNTGLPLPFISYGGTNLIFSIVAIGIITSIQRHIPEVTTYTPLHKLFSTRR